MATLRKAARGWALPAQLAGGCAALAGVYLYWGLAATLLAGGLSMIALGALREAKVI